MKKTTGHPVLPLVVFFCLMVGYAVWTFALTDPNLTLSSWSPYLQFQNYMWQTFFKDAQALSSAYLISITLLSGVFLWCVSSLHQRATTSLLSWRTIVTVTLFLALPLLFSYNALSHDVFNYMFNAKMVVAYQANPHRQVALDFASDPWTRFMHNTHTPAPYGYGWTGISLLPYWITTPIQHRFLPTWLLYRGLSLLSLAATVYVLRQVAVYTNRLPKSWWLLALFAWSPLVLLEIISNNHNDLWMMWPAVASIGLVAFKPVTWKIQGLSLAFLAFSISIKLATIVLLPLWMALVGMALLPNNVQQILRRFWPLAASFLLFVPLLTDRSQQFHPWYLVWVLVWMPLFGTLTNQGGQELNRFEKYWTVFIVALSITSLYRYLPWLQTGYFTESVILNQKMITWLPAIGVALVWRFLDRIRPSARSDR